MSKKIKVGFIGLNPDSHWAFNAHIPSLNFLSDKFEVVGVANSTHESAQRTAKELNLAHAFANPQELIESSEVELVVVTVKVPYHYEYVKAAIEAGKNIHCEWPLGNGLQEAKELASLAKEKGVKATVGTQMRVAPEVLYLKELLSEDYVGEVLSTTLVADAGQWGAETVADLAYLSDVKTGANMLTIPFAHTLAGIQEVLGNFTDISGRLITRRDKVLVTDTNETIEQTSADQIMANGVLANGAAFSAHYRGGMSRGTNFLWEINGTKGDIKITGNIGHGQFAEFSLFGASGDDAELKPLTLPSKYLEGRADSVIPRNVSGVYEKVANDINNGTSEAPSFEDAVQLHTLLDAIEKSSK